MSGPAPGNARQGARTDDRGASARKTRGGTGGARTGRGRVVLLSLLGAAVVLLPAAYGVFWHVVAGRIHEWIAYEWENAAANGIVIHGDFPRISGFPRAPVVRFGGRVETPDATIVVPSLAVRSFFIQGLPLSATLAEGLYLERQDGPLDREIWSLQYAALSGKIPERLPSTLREDRLRAWRDRGGVLAVDHVVLRKDTLGIEGSGTLRLDEALQPEGRLAAQITGYGPFILFLQRKNLIEARQSFLIGAILNGLAAADPETGEKVLTGTLTLTNGRLMMGPATLMTVPAIAWPQPAHRHDMP